MPSDSSKAHNALHDRADSKNGGSGSVGESQPARAEGASILPEPLDLTDMERALLAELKVGSVIDGKYRIDEVLGRGAMGVVVAATHLELGERVALKFLRYRSGGGISDDFQSRFKREARVSAKLKNEHITRVIDVGVWREHVPYMVMDHLTGIDLRQVLKTWGRLSLEMAIDYTVQVCDGIAEAHANGVVHRDLKPSNLFLTQRPDGSDLVKILDFGVSKWNTDDADIEDLTQTGVVLGSPKYMAPEQLFGSAEVDARADVWSIGAMLYEMLTGRPPFDLPTFTKICAELATDRAPPPLAPMRSDVPPELEAVVMRCFQRTLDLRVQDVAELAGDLLAAVKAPFAEAIRAKIAATLEPRSMRDSLSTSAIARSTSSGSYGAILGRSVSLRPPIPSAEVSAVPPAMLPGGLQTLPVKKLVQWLGLAAVAIVGLAALFLGRGHQAPAETRAVVSSSPTSVTALRPPSAVEPTAPPTASAASAAPPTPPSTLSSKSSSSAPLAASPTHGVVRVPWHSPASRSAAVAAAATASVPPQPTTTAGPVATTPPPSITTKQDPLGERQ